MAPPEGGRGRVASVDDRRRTAVADRRSEAASGKVAWLSHLFNLNFVANFIFSMLALTSTLHSLNNPIMFKRVVL